MSATVLAAAARKLCYNPADMHLVPRLAALFGSITAEAFMAGKKDTAATATKAPSLGGFEKSLETLEQLVRDLEHGELTLEQSLTAFERGVGLTRDCQQALKSAEQRVEMLVQNGDGSLETRPFLEQGNEQSVQNDQSSNS
jgi:exodeoxyribonuclease VII small subunit